MKTFIKAMLIILAFALCYCGIMLVVYNKFYTYPKGYLDIVERNDKALSYAIIRKVDLNQDGKTILYFSRSSNGGGDKAHFGIISSSLPPVFANFNAESNASAYLPMDAYGYCTTTLKDHPCYLYGTTTDSNTVTVRVTFFLEGDETRSVDMEVSRKCFLSENFDATLAQYPSRIYGFNADGGITFEYEGEAMSNGGYIAKNKQ